MRKGSELASVIDMMRYFQNRTSVFPTNKLQVQFDGYRAEDLDCKYCLHRSGKSQKCVQSECCCLEEKQQMALSASKI